MKAPVLPLSFQPHMHDIINTMEPLLPHLLSLIHILKKYFGSPGCLNWANYSYDNFSFFSQVEIRRCVEEYLQKVTSTRYC